MFQYNYITCFIIRIPLWLTIVNRLNTPLIYEYNYRIDCKKYGKDLKFFIKYGTLLVNGTKQIGTYFIKIFWCWKYLDRETGNITRSIHLINHFKTFGALFLSNLKIFHFFWSESQFKHIHKRSSVSMVIHKKSSSSNFPRYLIISFWVNIY